MIIGGRISRITTTKFGYRKSLKVLVFHFLKVFQAMIPQTICSIGGVAVDDDILFLLLFG